MWHNEIGVQSNWLDERISADLAFFYYDIDNYQVEEHFSQTDYAVINANKVTSYGVELSFETTLTDTIKILGGFAYTHATFADSFDPLNTSNINNKKAPYVPEFNVNISGLFKHPSGIFARLDFLWTGKTYFYAENSDSLSEQDYTVLNAHLGYQYKNFSVNAYVKNLSESQYFTQKIASLNIGVPGQPRTFGARVSIDF
jgi:iron complex outermembrane receptor protein